MSRLIDADALIDILLTENQRCITSTNYELSVNMIVSFIENQPTAYSVENVVAEISRSSGNGYRDIDGNYVPPMIETKDVIKIVRKGGAK